MGDGRNNGNSLFNQDTEEDRDYFIMIVNEMMSAYKITFEEVEELMIRSGFLELFKEDRDFFYHYQPEQIGEMIYKRKIYQNH